MTSAVSGQAQSEDSTKKYAPVNKPVFVVSAVVVCAFTLWAWLAPDAAQKAIFGAMDWVAGHFGWYYILTAGIIVIFVIAVAISRVGKTRLGPDHSRPQYSVFTWASMLFSAGIGVDVMFFAISGPATNYLTPPEAQPHEDEAARMATIWTMFHYGIPGWAMYALMGLALGLTCYRYHLPLTIRSALAPIFGTRVKGAAGDAVDIAAEIGTVFGIGTSLGIGVVFLNYGISEIAPVPINHLVQIILVVLAVAVATISTVSGVDKGIKFLSELNVLVALALLLYILFAGQTTLLLNELVQNIGDFFSRFPSMLFNSFAYTKGSPDLPSDQWLKNWTLFFWAWWIAWAPFVGLFLARISKGRTLREFVTGVLLIPFGYIFLWISILGNSAINLARSGQSDFVKQAADVPESGFFNLISQFPASTFFIALSVFVGFLFYVTSADSGALVMANMSSHATHDDADGRPSLRIFWAVVTGALTLAMLFLNGVYTLQAATVLIGLPFSVVMYLVMASVAKMLRAEGNTLDSRTDRVARALGDRPAATAHISWRQRLKRGMSFPDAQRVTDFITTTGQEAVDKAAEEMREFGHNVCVEHGTAGDTNLPYVDLTVDFEGQEPFKYELAAVSYPMPSYAPRADAGRDCYYTVEVFTARGTRGLNIMGYTQEQLLANIVDAYELHLDFMIKSGEGSFDLGDMPRQIPTEWDDAHRFDEAGQ